MAQRLCLRRRTLATRYRPKRHTIAKHSTTPIESIIRQCQHTCSMAKPELPNYCNKRRYHPHQRHIDRLARLDGPFLGTSHGRCPRIHRTTNHALRSTTHRQRHRPQSWPSRFKDVFFKALYRPSSRSVQTTATNSHTLTSNRPSSSKKLKCYVPIQTERYKSHPMAITCTYRRCIHDDYTASSSLAR